jgi:protein-S-isoprenylcysteine O-methyltransferase Ste14
LRAGRWSPGPSEYLLRSGPYRLSRNPMYVGKAVVWLGWAVLHGRAAVCAAGTTMVRWEEGRLLERFGDEYRGPYLAAVPRWVGLTEH